jgi:serine/threonine-protein kinase
MAKDPEARFVDGAAFVAAIEAVLEGRPLPAAPATVAVARVAAPAARGPGGGRSTGSRPATGPSSVSRPPAARRGGRVAMVLLPLLGLLAGAGIAAALFQSLAGPGPTAPAEAAELQEQTDTVSIDVERYVGRDVDDVVDELSALGLAVERRQVPTSEAAPGTVTGVDPVGVVPAGGTVVVSYAVAPGTGRGTGDGTGNAGDAVVPVDETTPTSAPTGDVGSTSAPTEPAEDTGTLPATTTQPTSATEPTTTSEPTEPTTTHPTPTVTPSTGTESTPAG